MPTGLTSRIPFRLPQSGQLPPTPERLPPTKNYFPAPPLGKRDPLFGESLMGMMYGNIRSQDDNPLPGYRDIYDTPALQMLDRVYGRREGGFARRLQHPAGEDYSIALLDSMYPNAAAPVDITPGYDQDNAYYSQKSNRIGIGTGVPPLARYSSLAHEREHEAQALGGGGIYQGDDPLIDLSSKAAAEVAARMASAIFQSEADRRVMKRPQWQFTGSEAEKLPFQPNYQPNLSWAREMARKHGVFDGVTVSELMARNPNWVRLISGN